MEVWYTVGGSPLSYRGVECRLKIVTVDGQPYTVNWGDGAIASYNSNTEATHTYNVNGELPFVTFPDKQNVKELIVSLNARISLAETTSMINLKRLSISVAADGTGSIADLPEGLTDVSITNARPGSVYGSTGDFPSTLIVLTCVSGTAIGGDVIDLPRGLIYINLQGQTTISGNVLDMPRGVTSLYVFGSNTLAGSVADFPPNLRICDIEGNNNIDGDIKYLPGTCLTLRLWGNCTVFGDVKDVNPGTIEFYVRGSNTVGGLIQDVAPTVQRLYVYGNGTVGGDLGLIAAGSQLTSIAIMGSGSMTAYTSGRSWPDGMRNLLTSSPLPPTAVDALLIDLALVNSWTTDKQITLTNSMSKRTAASDSAVLTLQSKGVNVQVTKQ